MEAIARMLVLVAAVMALPAGAQEFPSRPIALICPWPAGGSTDTHLRRFAEISSKYLGQPVVVENRPGGGGMIGPRGMELRTVRILHDGFRKALDDPEHLKVLEQLDQEPWYQSSEDYAKYARDTLQHERALIERLGLLAK